MSDRKARKVLKWLRHGGRVNGERLTKKVDDSEKEGRRGGWTRSKRRALQGHWS